MTTTSLSPSAERQLRAASFRAASLTLLGGVIIAVAFVYATLSLRQAELAKADLVAENIALEARTRDAQAEFAAVRKALAVAQDARQALASERDRLFDETARLRDGLGELMQSAEELRQALDFTNRERASLEAENIELTNSIETANLEFDTIAKSVATIEKQLKAVMNERDQLASELAEQRCALAASRSAIEAFHNKNYETAIDLYSDALRCDAENAYLLNLKAYALFKLKRLDEAIATQERSVAIDPEYAWGHFDLARFLCAAGPSGRSRAQREIQIALDLRPGLKPIMSNDGEFRRLCGDLVPK